LHLGDSPRANYMMKLKKLPRGILSPYIFWIVFALLESLISGFSQGEGTLTCTAHVDLGIGCHSGDIYRDLLHAEKAVPDYYENH